jgi:DivIVA domain-containing protein
MPLTPQDVPPPLTPEDVRAKEFGTTRLRPGYDQHEVDAFLALVEEALVDRDLQIEQAQGTQTRWFDPGPAWRGETERPADHGQVSGPPATAESTMTAAARLLEMAEESSASTVGEARQEAGRILSRARTEASTILTAARRQADQVTGETLRPLTEQRDELQRHIAGLRTLALELRSSLRAYADEPLPALDAGSGDEETVQAGHVPVPAGTAPPSGNGSAPGGWTAPGAHQDPGPAAPATHASNGHARPEDTDSPAPGPGSEPDSPPGGSQ